MQKKMYSEFERLLECSQNAFKYAEEHFSELMSRPVAHILYGPPSYGPGAACPSRRMTGDKERLLRPSTRRKSYKAYYFDAKWDLLYSRDYDESELDCTVLHFWIGETNYSRFFLGDTNDFYTSFVFSTHFVEKRPAYTTNVCSERIYVEYFREERTPDGQAMVNFSWYQYYPTRMYSKDGIPLSKEAEFGAENSPVFLGEGMFMPTDCGPLGYDQIGKFSKDRL